MSYVIGTKSPPEGATLSGLVNASMWYWCGADVYASHDGAAAHFETFWLAKFTAVDLLQMKDWIVHEAQR